MASRIALRIVVTGTVVVLLAIVAVASKAWYDSRLPDTYSVTDYGRLDLGDGSEPAPDAGHGTTDGTVGVRALRGPRVQEPDRRFELTARNATVLLDTGRTVDALTFNGRTPGPELRMRRGDLVEVTLANGDIGQGVTIHWHGVDVPNAEDGVAGVTQNAVLPGERYTYRFQVDQEGTFWYHSHQASSSQVRRGLLGAFVIEPREGSTADLDWALVAHTFDGVPTMNGAAGLVRRAVRPGTRVRLRVIDTDSTEQRFTLTGVPYRIAAIDGTDLEQPALLHDETLVVAAGGRVDVVFTMPRTPVRLSLAGTSAGIALSSDGRASPAAPPLGPDFDPLTYGRPAATPFDASSRFDRSFEFRITRKPGFFDGDPGLQWAINGGIHPDVPVFAVGDGERVAVRITNDSEGIHPMHLHGHHALVLSKDGTPASGSPWWTDTLNVRPGESYVVAFRANNPGIWMYHCHNLRHAADGLTTHLVYAGVSTPFRIGDAPGNDPE